MVRMYLPIKYSSNGEYAAISTAAISWIVEVGAIHSNRSNVPISSLVYGILVGAKAYEMVES